MQLPRTILDLASAQHGVVSRSQLNAAQITREAQRRLVRSGRLERRSPAVFVIPGGAHTRARDALIALLDAGPHSALCRGSAAAWWELPGFEAVPWHVVQAHESGSSRPAIATVHRTRFLPAHHLVMLHGVPCTSPDRTLVDLAADVGPSRLGRALDYAVTRRLVRMPAMFRTLDELARSGRTGVVAIRAALEARGIDYRPGDSGLEARFLEIVSRAGLFGFESQVTLYDPAGWVGRVDFVLRSAGIVIEVDSDLFHASSSDRQADEARDARLLRAGWRVLRVSETQLYHRPWQIIEAIRSLQAEQFALLGA
jgi:very-short-patch-repair endonuclease